MTTKQSNKPLNELLGQRRLQKLIPDGYFGEIPLPQPKHLEQVTFDVGTIVITPAAMEALQFEGAGTFVSFLLRHASRLKVGSRKQEKRPLAGCARFDLRSTETLLVMVEAEEHVTTVMKLGED